MPDPISRRDVLTAAAIASAGMAISPLLTGCSTARPAAPSTSTPINDPSHTPVTLNINGTPHTLHLEPRTTLLDALREDAQLPGTKKGCDHGQCGACTVLIDNRRVLSCLTLAIAAQNKSITTIEGLAQGDQLHPLQSAFIEKDAFQCGYCTPGQICSAVGLLHEAHAKSDDDIREQMAGNICRCGAYPNIVAAIRAAMPQA